MRPQISNDFIQEINFDILYSSDEFLPDFESILNVINDSITNFYEEKYDLELIANQAFPMPLTRNNLLNWLRPIRYMSRLGRFLYLKIDEYIQRNDDDSLKKYLLAILLFIEAIFSIHLGDLIEEEKAIYDSNNVFLQRFWRRFEELETKRAQQPVMVYSKLKNKPLFERGIIGIVSGFLPEQASDEQTVYDIDDLIAAKIELKILLQPQDAKNTIIQIEPFWELYLLPLSLFDTKEWIKRRRPRKYLTKLYIFPRGNRALILNEARDHEEFFGKGRDIPLETIIPYDLDRVDVLDKLNQ